MAELTNHLAARLNGDVFIDYIASDTGGVLDEKVLCRDRAVHESCKPGGLRHDATPDFAIGALNQIGATQVPFDFAVDMQVHRRANIAGNDDIAANDGEGRIPSPGCRDRYLGSRRAEGQFSGLREHRLWPPGNGGG